MADISHRRPTIILGKIAVIVSLALGLLVMPLATDAQQAAKVPRIGWLAPAARVSAEHLVQAFLRGLRDLGWVEGQNIVIEWRFAEGKFERLPHLAAELVGLKVDVVVATAPPAIQAAKQVTSTIPIVVGVGGAPVELGFVPSLARPGGNITGWPPLWAWR